MYSLAVRPGCCRSAISFQVWGMRMFCVPGNVSLTAVAGSNVKYMLDNKQKLHYGKLQVLAMAIHCPFAMPC